MSSAWAVPDANAFVITDENVFRAWGAAIPAGLPTLVLPPGEAAKSMSEYERCLRWLISQKADRRSTLVGFGGGVIGDLAGFVAATYFRGISYRQIPTTLLAQVDSSVGGKVAIDLPEGKNLVGAFYPPESVWIAKETLRTLAPREFVNGLAEVWKYGFILDPELIQDLSGEALAPDSSRLESVVERCIRLKTQVVTQDELDLTGLRAILNFGHTVGHALEAIENYQGLRHGEAISVGMVVEADLGERLGLTEIGTARMVRECLAGAGLPVSHPLLTDSRTLEAMKRDKKSEGGNLSFSLLTRIGECKLVASVPEDMVKAALCAR